MTIIRFSRRRQGNPDQIVFGTPENDMIAEYGDTNTVSQYAEGGAGNDWILQVGGDQNSDQTAIAGDGNDTIYQYGGKGDSIQYAERWRCRKPNR